MSPYDPMSEFVQREVCQRWRVPCEAMFDWLAGHHEHELCRWVASGALRDNGLTFAAEAVGKIKDSDLALAVLMPLLDNPSSLVREGAIYGISRHMDDAVAARLTLMSLTDTSPAIRECAREALDR